MTANKLTLQEWWDTLTTDQRLKELTRYGLNTQFSAYKWKEIEPAIRDRLAIYFSK